MPRLLAAALAVVLIAASPPPPPAGAPPPDAAPAPAHNAAIVGGHRVQPRANAAGGAPDSGISKRDAEDLDRLYQELTHQATPAGLGSSTTPQ